MTNFAWSKIEWPKASLKGELQDVIRNPMDGRNNPGSPATHKYSLSMRFIAFISTFCAQLACTCEATMRYICGIFNYILIALTDLKKLVIKYHLIQVNIIACASDEPFELSCVFTVLIILQMRLNNGPNRSILYC